MSPTRSMWLLAMLLCTALLAGCGSSSSSTTTATTSSTPAASTPTTSSTATASTSAATTPTSTTPTAPANPSASSITQLAATVCKSTAARANLPAALKAKVEEICHQAATGHQAQAIEEARKICVESINAIPGPNTPEKEKALKECTAAK